MEFKPKYENKTIFCKQCSFILFFGNVSEAQDLEFLDCV